MIYRFVGQCAGALLAAFLLAPAPSRAAQAEQRFTPVQMFELADVARNERRWADAEAIYRALTADPDVEIRSEARFRLAQMLSERGRHRDAAVLLRALLDERPEAARARIELARVLALLGDEAGAGRALRQAQASGLPPDVALAVDQFAQALRAVQPVGGSLSFAIVPDSNINRATRRETLDTIIAPLELSEDAREQSGIGVRIGAQSYARLPLAPNISLLPRVSAQAELYGREQFNDLSTTAAVGLDISSGRSRIRPSLGHSWRVYGGSLYARTATGSLNWTRPLGTRAQLDTTVTAARADYMLNDLQDGWLFDLATTYERALDARSGGGVTFSVSRQSARDPGYASTSGGISILYGREMGRVSLFGTAGARRLEADERLFLFPERRREWLLSAGIGGAFRDLTVAGFAPLVRVNFERNISTVGIYDYSRVALDFGITRAF